MIATAFAAEDPARFGRVRPLAELPDHDASLMDHGPTVRQTMMSRSRLRSGRPGPLVVGHGTFVVRNLFESPTGRITLIDPLPRWLVPGSRARCPNRRPAVRGPGPLRRGAADARAAGGQPGWAFRPRQLDAYETAFLAGSRPR